MLMSEGNGLFHAHAATNHVPRASKAQQENPLRPSRSPYLDMLEACSGGAVLASLAQVVEKKARLQQVKESKRQGQICFLCQGY